MNGYLIMTVLVHGVLLWASWAKDDDPEDEAIAQVVRGYLMVMLVWGVLLMSQGSGAG